jgi:hypothetical protein
VDSLFSFCHKADDETVGRIASLLWCSWYNRNDNVRNNTMQSPIFFFKKMTFDMLNEWFSVHNSNQNSRATTMANVGQWEKVG